MRTHGLKTDRENKRDVMRAAYTFPPVGDLVVLLAQTRVPWNACPDHGKPDTGYAVPAFANGVFNGFPAIAGAARKIASSSALLKRINLPPC